MAGRPKHYEEDTLIDRAINVFWKKGYHAASAQDLMKAMEIGQGSFYHSFPGGKKELYQKSLTHFLKQSIRQFYAGLGESNDPIEFIRAFFNRIAERPQEDKQNGCYLGNALVEWSNLDEETQALSAELLLKLKEGFEKALTDAQKMGNLAEEKSPSLLATHLVNLWNGLNITQRMPIKDSQVKELIELNLRVLD